MIQISQIKLQPIKQEDTAQLKDRLRRKAAGILKISENQLKELCILKESIDARKKNQIVLIYTISVSVNGEDKILSHNKLSNVTLYNKAEYNPILFEDGLQKNDIRPIIVGLGPCGLFCGYLLALNGFRPIILERGKDVDLRQKDVDSYWTSGKLNVESNVQFGEGGAGTFSDGKLNTQIKDQSGRIRFVLDTLVSFGADESIKYNQHPHVGTDVLKDVVKNLRNEIIRLGGEVRFQSKLTGIQLSGNKITGILVNGTQEIKCESLVLAIGHSARDTFEMLKTCGATMTPKEFAVGYRVSHPQAYINVCQYGESYADYFEAAPYKLTAKSNDNRGVYTFCMCPGGYVVDASSEEGRLCVNGMSYSDRGSENANSAVIVSVSIEDYKRAVSEKYHEDPLVGMYFQRQIEENTYRCANGKIPVQTYGSFYRDVKGTEPEKSNENNCDINEVTPILKGRYEFVSLMGIYPREIEMAFIDGMESFSRKMHNFNHPNTLIMASETRTSSPVRIERDENGMSNLYGLFPAGEGAGYAGGITSAAVDGIKAAEYVMKKYRGVYEQR